jgi:lysophospholipase L1-like esterase
MALEVQIAHEGGWRGVDSADLRERDGTVVVRLPTGLRPGEVRTCIWWLPVISTCAIAGVAVAEGAVLEAATPPAPRWLAIGDSLTQGFSVQSPLATWVHRLSRRWDLPALNLGIGGVTIEPLAFQWALERKAWDLVTIALGSNHAWREATVATAADKAAELAGIALAGGHGKVVWILPPWKPMEEGKGPSEFMGVPLDAATGQRIGRVRDALRERLAGFGPRLQVVEDLMPHDHRYYPDGLHPFALGFARYADALAAAIHPYGG